MKYTSNMNAVIVDLKGRLKDAGDVSKLQRTIATNLKASNLRRIHNHGIALNGTPIGSYSTKPMYVNPRVSPRKFSGLGKEGAKTFKSGRAHKTRYFGTGYKGFRGFVGRPTGHVNLQMSGTLLRSWQAEKQGSNWVVGFNSPYGSRVARGNEERFGKTIWGVSAPDATMIKTTSEEFVNRSLKKKK